MDCNWNFATDNIYNNTDYTTQIGTTTFYYSKTLPLQGDVQYLDENENLMFTQYTLYTQPWKMQWYR